MSKGGVGASQKQQYTNLYGVKAFPEVQLQHVWKRTSILCVCVLFLSVIFLMVKEQ